MAFTQKIFSSYQPYSDGNTRIGELYRLWYDSNTNTLRIQLDNTSGGTIIGSGVGGVGTLDQVTDLGNTTTNDITVGDITTDKVIINTTAGATVTTGEIAWNTADLTFDMGMANGVTLQVGQEIYIKVKAYEAISDGQSVMFAGVEGEHIMARKYDPTVANFIPEWFVGVATQDLAHNSFGYITTYGKVNKLNTLAYTAGDILYADNNTPGGLTNVRPTDPNTQIIVAVVTKRAGGDGHIFVRSSWRPSLDLITDVTITAPTSGQVLKYNGTTWTNQAVNGPAFRAYVSVGQSISSGSQQKVIFGTETFDTNSCFTNSTFTPTVEGYYQFNATVRISGTASTGECMLVLYKNGTEYARGNNESGTEQGASFYSMQISDIAYANGTTDNFEIYIQQTSGDNRDTTAGSPISYFSGCMIRGA